MIRYHSFYPVHREGEYTHLMNEHDHRMMDWVRKFNPYDLYSKGHERPDVDGPHPLLPGPDRRVLPGQAGVVKKDLSAWQRFHHEDLARASAGSPWPLPLPEVKSLASFAPPRKRRWRAGVESRSIWLYQAVTIRVNSSIFSSCSRVYCFGRVARLRLVDAVLQQGDRRVHLAPLPLGHDDPERLHHVLERLEPVAAVADDVDPADHAPGDQLAEARRDVRPAHVEQLADLLGVERLGRDEQAGRAPGPSSG